MHQIYKPKERAGQRCPESFITARTAAAKVLNRVSVSKKYFKILNFGSPSKSIQYQQKGRSSTNLLITSVGSKSILVQQQCLFIDFKEAAPHCFTDGVLLFEPPLIRFIAYDHHKISKYRLINRKLRSSSPVIISHSEACPIESRNAF
ncbi:hypothetical protein NPIL_409741 [Nephila pilipes]|uniref:Uncharacterized protein n=1 Tax=Nephila pilipes TaxID=299642 RepID=A0A8X6NVP2_NEPPI|nr:hypothetical protein NPIL_409741 [Nephila pilipes]